MSEEEERAIRAYTYQQFKAEGAEEKTRQLLATFSQMRYGEDIYMLDLDEDDWEELFRIIKGGQPFVFEETELSESFYCGGCTCKKEYCISAKPDTAHASRKHDKENK